MPAFPLVAVNGCAWRGLRWRSLSIMQSVGRECMARLRAACCSAVSGTVANRIPRKPARAEGQRLRSREKRDCKDRVLLPDDNRKSVGFTQAKSRGH